MAFRRAVSPPVYYSTSAFVFFQFPKVRKIASLTFHDMSQLVRHPLNLPNRFRFGGVTIVGGMSNQEKLGETPKICGMHKINLSSKAQREQEPNRDQFFFAASSSCLLAAENGLAGMRDELVEVFLPPS